LGHISDEHRLQYLDTQTKLTSVSARYQYQREERANDMFQNKNRSLAVSFPCFYKGCKKHFLDSGKWTQHIRVAHDEYVYETCQGSSKLGGF
jgi:hypothetical protein